MKYTSVHPPLVCLQRESACYLISRPMAVRGVLWHSTGANNPELRRYVQPADDDPDRERLLSLLGKNAYGNDYNHGSKNRAMGVNAWIGKLASGEVAAVQALPWDWKPWGCGAGKNGSLNDGWIQFEICEDALIDEQYAMSAYREACELTAFLMTAFGLDPHGTARVGKQDVPVILDHRESHELGLGSNHGDVRHWFPRLIGKTMEDVRNDVSAIMAGGDVAPSPLQRGMRGERVRSLQETLALLGYDLGPSGADGVFGSVTEAAVYAFQRANGFNESGIAEAGLISLMEGMKEAVNLRYTVVVRDLDYAGMESLRRKWPGCEVIAQ